MVLIYDLNLFQATFRNNKIRYFRIRILDLWHTLVKIKKKKKTVQTLIIL